MNQGWLRMPALFSMLSRLCLQSEKKTSQSAWLQEAATRCAELLHLEVKCDGPLPTDGMVVANHLGYVDVIAIASVMHCRFIAKKEVKNWPLFGMCATKGGTLYLDRNSRSAVGEMGKIIADALRSKLPLVLFPEGTSSDGTRVLPFRPSLFEAALQNGSPITPAHISYQLSNGSVEQEVAYHGEMVLLPHLANLLDRKKIVARIHFGSPQVLGLDRKTAAKFLRNQVEALAPQSLASPDSANQSDIEASLTAERCALV